MPNWCEGKLKIRGKEEDIINFIKEGTSLLKGFWEVEELVPDIEKDLFGELIIKNKDSKNNIDTLYIKETSRHFIKLNEEIFISGEDKREQRICVDFKSAWSIDTDSLREISEKYNVDFKIYAFENGMEFNQDIEIIKGKIIKDDTIEFEDYYWECINPQLGG